MPFKKGDPNINRKGRPREGTTITDLLKEKLNKEEFVEKLIQFAYSGNTKALEMIYDRIDGKQKELVEHSADRLEILIVEEKENCN